MFTGLIEQKARVVSNEVSQGVSRLTLASPFEHILPGESIAVNGVCLTVIPQGDSLISFDVSSETINKTTLESLSVQDEVNLERAMQADTRFGGHYVSGHVDGTALVQSIHLLGAYIDLELGGFSAKDMLHLMPKGSITVDGVSLTINSLENRAIKIMLVPHTLSHTTLGTLRAGQQVNIEFDYLSRIVAHQLQHIGTMNYEEVP
ncbi:MAG: riboflavin synthase [Legionellales bacterium]